MMRMLVCNPIGYLVDVHFFLQQASFCFLHTDGSQVAEYGSIITL